MNGEELKAARVALDLTRADFGAAVGLESDHRRRQQQVSAWERENDPIPRHVVLLTECLLQGARPSTWPSGAG